jgi:ligand-binding SRPBCC domain-containing protein
MRHLYVKRLGLARSAHDVFAWHERPDSLQKLIPPRDPVRVVDHRPGKQGAIGDGARVVLELGRWPLRKRWVAVHEGFIPDRQFIDVQVHGPFAFWRHTHSIIPSADGACVLEDRVEYELPMGALGEAVARGLVRGKIKELFAWRHRVTFQSLILDH